MMSLVTQDDQKNVNLPKTKVQSKKMDRDFVKNAIGGKTRKSMEKDVPHRKGKDDGETTGDQEGDYIESSCCESESNEDEDTDMESDTSSSAYKCGVCSKEFNTPKILKSHILRFHDPRLQKVVEGKDYIATNQSFVCSKCSKDFKTSFALRIHKPCNKIATSKTKKGKCVYSCPEKGCGEVIRSRQNLGFHISMCHFRAKDALFQCCHCKVYYFERVDVIRHVLRSHQEEKEFVCDVKKCAKCAKTFRTVAGLKVHQRKVHASDNIDTTSYEGVYYKKHTFSERCNKCDKNFKKATHWRFHFPCTLQKRNDPISRETGKLFKCPVCDFEAKAARNLHQHINRMHFVSMKDLLYECMLCHKRLHTKVCMELHLKSAHGIDIMQRESTQNTPASTSSSCRNSSS